VMTTNLRNRLSQQIGEGLQIPGADLVSILK
jgi:hypothetical protein